jgi:hypothetical protein
VGRIKAAFAGFGGPAEFAAGAGFEFNGDQAFVREADGVPGAQPDEVEELMDEDARKLDARAIE